MREAIAIVGVCVAERRQYVRRVATATQRRIVQVVGGPRHGYDLGSLSMPPGVELPDGVILDGATDVDIAHLAGGESAPLVVCVVDTPHLLSDLRDDAPLSAVDEAGDDRADVGARARQAVAFIEAASMVAFVNWETVETARLSMLMALASHLNPSARIRLTRDPGDDVSTLTASAGGPWQQRAGWVNALNGDHAPHMTDARITTFRYEQLRPFHPGRLVRALDELVDAGAEGALVRSAGLCRLATRPRILARWEQVGSAMWIDPLVADESLASTGQELAFTGIDLRPPAIVRALDAAAVTDTELAGGPAAWRRFADPLPRWPLDAETSEIGER